MKRSHRTHWLALAALLLVPTAALGEHIYVPGACLPATYCDSSCDGGSCDDVNCDGGCDDEEPCSYGPCACESRGTLMQWSYGTSFSGGPPGFDEPLATDRPDFTEASVTVGRGVAQIEYGYTYIFDEEGGDQAIAHVYPGALLRVGMFADWLEFRLGWTYAEERTRTGGVETRLRGAQDLYVGAKIALTPQEGILPEMAITPQALVPSGSGVFTNEEVLPGLNWLYGWDITDDVSFGGSTQGNRFRDDSGDFFTLFAQSLTVGYGLTDRLSAYTEWFVLIPHGADTFRNQHYFNGGFTFLLNNNSQLDVRAGVGLSTAADDYFIGAGHSQRF